MRELGKAVLLVLAFLAALFFIMVVIPECDSSNRQRVHTTELIMRCVQTGAMQYQAEYKSWPSSLVDLTNNSKNLNFVIFSDQGAVDGWGHALIFQPFDAAKGYGVVISYGRDGKPGGTGADADLEVRFGP